MPTYQYSCTECDHAFEQFQSFSDDALSVCPRCQGRLRKIFNAVGVVFKGSGFYPQRQPQRRQVRRRPGEGGLEVGVQRLLLRHRVLERRRLVRRLGRRRPRRAPRASPRRRREDVEQQHGLQQRR